MEVSYTLTAEDLRTYLEWSAGQAALAAQFRRARVSGALVFVAIALIFALSAAARGGTLMLVFTGLLLLGAVAAWFLLPGRFRATYARNGMAALLAGNTAYLLGPRTARISAEGFALSAPGLAASYSWGLVDHIASAASGVYVFLGSQQAHIVPRSAFATYEDMRRFAEAAAEYHKGKAGAGV